MEVGALIVDRHLPLLLKRDVKELARAGQITQEEAHAGVHFIRTLDPRPGRSTTASRPGYRARRCVHQARRPMGGQDE